jgi:hypothetical protein
LTSTDADWAPSCPQLSSDHDCPCVTVVGRSLSHADRTSRLGASVSRPLRPELAPPRCAVLTRRPSVFQAGHIPSWRGSCECYALSQVAAGSRWLLLLLSAARHLFPGVERRATVGHCSGVAPAGTSPAPRCWLAASRTRGRGVDAWLTPVVPVTAPDGGCSYRTRLSCGISRPEGRMWARWNVRSLPAGTWSWT